MTPTLLIACLQKVVLGLLSAKTSDVVREWWKSKPAEIAIESTARVLQQEYEDLGSQLREWSKRPGVAEALLRFSRAEMPAPGTAEELLREFDAVFQAAPGQTSAEQVLLWFFREFHEASLAAEGMTYTAHYLQGEIRASNREVLEKLESFQPLTASAVSSSLPATEPPLLPGPAGEALPAPLQQAKTLIEDGKPRAALELLRLLEGQPVAQTEAIRYELAATRGSALLELGQHHKAEEAFRAALDLRPTRGNALANLGLARLLQHDYSGAQELADQALALDAGNVSATRLKVQALALQAELGAAEDLARSLPADIDRREILGFLALRRHDAAGAVEHYTAVHEAKPGNPGILARLAHAQLLQVQEHLRGREYAPWGKLDPEMRGEIDRAMALLHRAVEGLERTDDRQELAQSLLDRAGLRAFLGDPRAEADFTRGLELDPVSGEAVRQAAEYWLPLGHADRVVPYLERTRAAGRNSPELDLLYGRALLQLHRPAEAERVLEPLAAAESLQRDVLLVRLEARIEREDLAGAERLLAEVPQDQRLEWKVATLSAQLLGKQGRTEEAIALLRQALPVASPQHRWRLHLSLGRHFLEQERWDEAAGEYGQVVTPDTPPELLRHYVSALYNADRVEECLAFCVKVGATRGLLPEVAEVEALARAALGQLTESGALYKEIQEAQPEEPKWAVKRAYLAARGGDRAQAASLLPDSAFLHRLDWRDGLDMAALQSLAGDLTGSLETAFRIARAHPDVPDAQLRYVGIFFAADAVLGDTLDVTAVAPGTWVTIEARGQREVHELLESPAQPPSRTQHFQDAFARAVLGKHVGDELVLVADPLGQETAKIVEIRSKYVGLLQDTLLHFNQSFPQTEGLRAVTFAGPDDLEPLRRSLTARAERVDQLLANYASMPMPISMLGKALSLTDVEVWEALAGWEAGRPVYIGAGSPEALAQYATLADASTPLVLESTSLWALARLGLLAELPLLGRELFVAQSVVDDLEGLRVKRELDLRRPGEHITVVVRDGELGRIVTTPEALQQSLAHAEQVLAWVREHCQVLGVAPGPERHRRTLLEGLSRGAYDSVLLTRDQKAVLLSEDMRLRGFAEAEFQRPGLASVHLLGGMLRRQVISAERYEEALATAAEWNYEFVSFSHRTLAMAFQLDGYMAGRKVQAVLRRLANSQTDAGPVVVLAAEFMRELMLGTLPRERWQIVLHALFAALAGRPDWGRLEGALRLRLQERLKIHPLALETLELELEAWKRARLLP